MSGADFPEELSASPDVLITAAVRTANDFENPERRTSTELSEYIWSLKDENVPFTLKWENFEGLIPFAAM